MKKFILTGILLSTFLTVAQENENVQSGSLPIGLTDAERANLRDYFSARSSDRLYLSDCQIELSRDHYWE